MADPDLLPLSGTAPQHFFRDRLNDGGCLVLLDGLDEVVDHQARDCAVDKINRWSEPSRATGMSSPVGPLVGKKDC